MRRRRSKNPALRRGDMDGTPLSRDGAVAAPPLPVGGATMALTVDPAKRARLVGMYVADAATLQDGGRYTRLPAVPRHGRIGVNPFLSPGLSAVRNRPSTRTGPDTFQAIPCRAPSTQLTPRPHPPISRPLRRAAPQKAACNRVPAVPDKVSESSREAHLPTVEAGPQASARVPHPHGHRRRPEGVGQPPRQGSQETVRLKPARGNRGVP